MNQATRITLVDDDRNILTSVSMALEAAGYAVTAHDNGAQALEKMFSDGTALVVLDVKMPRLDGFEVLAAIRKQAPLLPVVFLTSKDDEADQLEGLSRGADDYITKPFSQKLLLARIDAVLRRQRARDGGAETPVAEIIKRGDLALDDARQTASWRGQVIDLTVTEFLLLRTLADHPGHVKSRNQLMDHAYGENVYLDDRTVDSHIKRIRRKFKAVDDTFDRIDAVYGAGYKYRED